MILSLRWCIWIRSAYIWHNSYEEFRALVKFHASLVLCEIFYFNLSLEIGFSNRVSIYFFYIAYLLFTNRLNSGSQTVKINYSFLDLTQFYSLSIIYKNTAILSLWECLLYQFLITTFEKSMNLTSSILFCMSVSLKLYSIIIINTES